MSERLLPGPPIAEGARPSTSEHATDTDVVDAEILEETKPPVPVPPPRPAAGRTSDRPGSPWRPRPSVDVRQPPARSDFLSWRTAMTRAVSRRTARRLTWPRLLGFLAATLLFVVLVSLVVLVAL